MLSGFRSRSAAVNKFLNGFCPDFRVGFASRTSESPRDPPGFITFVRPSPSQSPDMRPSPISQHHQSPTRSLFHSYRKMPTGLPFPPPCCSGGNRPLLLDHALRNPGTLSDAVVPDRSSPPAALSHCATNRQPPANCRLPRIRHSVRHHIVYPDTSPPPHCQLRPMLPTATVQSRNENPPCLTRNH